MRLFIASCFMALAVTTTGIIITSPTAGQCVDLSQDLFVNWTSVSTDPPNIEFNITNFNGAFPPINQRYPSAPSTPVQSSLNQYTLPGVAQDAATLLASVNHGRAFEIWIVTPDDSSHFGSQQFNLGWAAEGCNAGSTK